MAGLNALGDIPGAEPPVIAGLIDLGSPLWHNAGLGMAGLFLVMAKVNADSVRPIARFTLCLIS